MKPSLLGVQADQIAGRQPPGELIFDRMMRRSVLTPG
jgi:hypothetical protein